MPVLLAAAVALYAYPFFIYPALMKFLVRLKPQPVNPPADLPCVAMVICALNEERVIEAKVSNCLELDYPKDKLRVIVVSDGSTDRTADIVRRYPEVELIERPQRRGKVSNVNQVVASLEEPVVLFSDANVIYHPAAVRHLMQRFADPTVGCVSGKVVLKNTTAPLQSGEEDYYSIEWTLQEKASAIYSMAGADGAMHAVRRTLFTRCPDDTLIEDFVMPMGVVRQGKRVVFEPKAIAWEDGPASLREEFRRKVRIAAGAAQALLRGNGWPANAPLRFWFIWMSHKLLRWLSPLIGLLVLILALLSWDTLLGKAVLVGWAVLAIAALMRVNAAFYFLFGQAAILVGLVKGVTGTQSVLWAKQNR